MKELEKQLNEILKRLGSDSNKIDMIQEEESNKLFPQLKKATKEKGLCKSESSTM